jgi:hypothetical protein
LFFHPLSHPVHPLSFLSTHTSPICAAHRMPEHSLLKTAQCVFLSRQNHR